MAEVAFWICVRGHGASDFRLCLYGVWFGFLTYFIYVLWTWIGLWDARACFVIPLGSRSWIRRLWSRESLGLLYLFLVLCGHILGLALSYNALLGSYIILA